MNCSACGGPIESPLLAEVQFFLCPLCGEIVIVKDVVISAKKISKNLSFLRDLLATAKDKFNKNKSDSLDSQFKHDVDKRLAMLLRREDFRLKISHDLLVQIDIEGNKISARLLNISSTGAAIEFFEQGQLPDDDSEIKLRMQLPGQSASLSLLARVVWARKTTEVTISPTVIMGLQFKNIGEETRSIFWDFIVNAETSDRK
jgi:predicted RNA-binding Zn-ribbon protein involved in translation (DUF1610 family)